MTRPSSVAVPFLGALSYSIAGKVSVMIFGFGTLMVVARTLAPEQIGVFILMLAAALFLMELSSFGLHQALPRALAAEDDEVGAKRLAESALAFRLITLAITAAIAWLSADALASLFGLDVPADLRIFLPLLVLGEGLFKFYTVVLQGRYQFERVALANVISSITNAAATLSFLLVFDWGIEALFVGKILARSVALVYCVSATRLRLARPTRARLEAVLRFGTVLQANYVLSFVYQRIDTFLIAGFLGPAELALYEIARRLPDVLIDLHEAFIVVFYPFVSGLSAEGRIGRIEYLTDTANRWTGFVGGMATLGAFMFGEAILTILFSAQYADGWVVFGLLIFAVCLVAFDSNLGYVLLAVGGAANSVVVSIIRTIAGLGLYLVLLPTFDLVGAAATNSLSLLIAAPALLYFVRKRGVHPAVGSFAGSLLLAGLSLAIWHVFTLDAVWQRLTLLACYALVCGWAGFFALRDVRDVIDRIPSVTASRREQHAAAPIVAVDNSVAGHRPEEGESSR